MKCWQCEHPETKVIESRESKDGMTIRRRRECIECSYRFTTFERPEERPLYVIKKQGQKEVFSKAKLFRSISLACQKRSIDPKQIEVLTDWVEKMFLMSEEREISSQKLGEVVLDGLLKLDPVAYVRFASVYRAFSTPEDFVDELHRLTEKAKNSPFVVNSDLKKDE